MASPESDRIFTALGKITFAWSSIDTLLDFVNDSLYHEFGGKELAPVLPHTSLEMKIEFFRRCVTDSPILEDSKRAIGIDFAKKLSQMADRRHWMVHGISVAIEGEKITFFRARIKRRLIERRDWTLAELDEFYGESVTLGFGLGLFFALNLSKMPAEEQDDYFRTLMEECGAILEIREKPSDSKD